MIATPLPCNITEYKTLAICHVIFIWASNILLLHMNFIRWERGQNGSFDVEGCRPLVYGIAAEIHAGDAQNTGPMKSVLFFSKKKICFNFSGHLFKQ